MREKFVSFNTERRERFVVRRRSSVGTGWLGDHPDVRGCSDFWVGNPLRVIIGSHGSSPEVEYTTLA